MHAQQLSAGRPGGLKAKATIKPVNFICLAPGATSVSIVGDFNQWNPESHPMKKHVDGSWQTSVPLGHGGHHYQFVVDGKLINDPRANGLARNAKGEKVSMLFVS
jgi:1,4-alpha-glucan branching enzyme